MQMKNDENKSKIGITKDSKEGDGQLDQKRTCRRERACRNRKFAAAGLLFLLAAAFLRYAAASVNGFADVYGEHIYPLLAGAIGGGTGIGPFSIVEFGLYGLIAAGIVYGVIFRRQPLRLISRTLFLLGLLFFSYVTCCGINYYRTPFSEYAGIAREEASLEELKGLCRYLTEQVNQYESCSGKRLSLNEYGAEGRAAMKKLGEEYPVLNGSYPNPKPLAVSRILSVQQLSGIYSPFTIEANYNREMVAYNIPHTVCHELSHLKGFMREDEANFIGYLACIGSDSRQFRYSGYLLGWIYATNALAGEDPESYMELYRLLEPGIVKDLDENTAFWNRFDGKVAEAADRVNDAYLKINDQQDGVKSYGRVVDLMLAHYRDLTEKA